MNVSLRRKRVLLFILGLPAFAGSPVPGIKNFYQVNPQVYRGGQPTEEGFGYLAKIGVKAVIDLREHDQRSLAEERTVAANGMRYINVPMTGLTAPTEAEISRILVLLEDQATGPVFVHCKRGADRTGAVIGAYRIDHDGWDNSKALSEAMKNGMSFFQFPRQKFIRTFQARTAEARAIAKPVEVDGVRANTAATDLAQKPLLMPAAEAAGAVR